MSEDYLFKPFRMIGEKSFVCQHLWFKTSDMVELVTTDEESFPAVLFLKKIAT
jgi:hypothetical protein